MLQSGAGKREGAHLHAGDSKVGAEGSGNAGPGLCTLGFPLRLRWPPSVFHLQLIGVVIHIWPDEQHMGSPLYSLFTIAKGETSSSVSIPRSHFFTEPFSTLRATSPVLALNHSFVCREIPPLPTGKAVVTPLAPPFTAAAAGAEAVRAGAGATTGAGGGGPAGALAGPEGEGSAAASVATISAALNR